MDDTGTPDENLIRLQQDYNALKTRLLALESKFDGSEVTLILMEGMATKLDTLKKAGYTVVPFKEAGKPERLVVQIVEDSPAGHEAKKNDENFTNLVLTKKALVDMLRFWDDNHPLHKCICSTSSSPPCEICVARELVRETAHSPTNWGS